MQDMTQESSEHPKLTAINAKLRERQEAQETREREVKAELTQKAADYLKEFYQVKSIAVLVLTVITKGWEDTTGYLNDTPALASQQLW